MVLSLLLVLGLEELKEKLKLSGTQERRVFLILEFVMGFSGPLLNMQEMFAG